MQKPSVLTGISFDHVGNGYIGIIINYRLDGTNQRDCKLKYDFDENIFSIWGFFESLELFDIQRLYNTYSTDRLLNEHEFLNNIQTYGNRVTKTPLISLYNRLTKEHPLFTKKCFDEYMDKAVFDAKLFCMKQHGGYKMLGTFLFYLKKNQDKLPYLPTEIIVMIVQACGFPVNFKKLLS
jgi:hypothetical protein